MDWYNFCTDFHGLQMTKLIDLTGEMSQQLLDGFPLHLEQIGQKMNPNVFVIPCNSI